MEIIFYIIIGGIVIWYLSTSFLLAKGVSHIETTELKKLLKDNNYQLIDVRTLHEFSANHIKGFKNIRISQMRQKQYHLDKEKNIVLLCQSGMRSNKAARKLKKWGFEQVTNVRGGIVTWRN